MINKLLSFYILLRYGKLSSDVKYYYRDTYYCNLTQLRYLIKDYLIKKKYKTTSFQGEFAPELQFALPFAYWHFKNGTLKSTISSKGTKELYFFSSDHQELFDHRTHEGNSNYEIPRVLYSQDYDMSKWAQVPLKETYKNEIYKFDKPILIIANRFNSEWGGPPLSFLSIELLSYIIEKLKSTYTIIYNRPSPKDITMDNSDILDLNEFKWLKKDHPEVILMEDLYKENKGEATNFNHLQLMVYANASKFISTHGGTSVLASYFGGTNLILSKKGPEHHFNCYNTLYPKLSGAVILHAKTDDQVKQYVNEFF